MHGPASDTVRLRLVPYSRGCGREHAYDKATAQLVPLPAADSAAI